MAASNNRSQIISTYALGSCIGLIAFDPSTYVGGILHFMLPDSSLSADKARARPSMFCDTGCKYFFSELEGLGAKLPSLKIMIAGGASVIQKSDFFKIGARNEEAIRTFLDNLGLKAQAESVGGLNNRTVHLSMIDGTVKLKMPNQSKKYSLL